MKATLSPTARRFLSDGFSIMRHWLVKEKNKDEVQIGDKKITIRRARRKKIANQQVLAE